MSKVCSFCGKREGDYYHDVKQPTEEDLASYREMGMTEGQISALLARQPERPVLLVMPGPDDLAICNVCTGLYSDTVQRELGDER